MSFKASAPGSLMLLGEYAVVEGKPALACAVDKRITVVITPRHDEQITISSPALGDYHTTLKKIKIEKPFTFILGTLAHFRNHLKFGCDITVAADFATDIGFGSSAAVTVATVTAINAWLKLKPNKLELLRQSRKIIRDVQQRGSGTDAAASIFGGIVAYYPAPLHVKKYSVAPSISILYSGYKTTTVVALETIRKHFAKMPALYKKICDAIGQCVTDGELALRKKDWAQLGAIMNIQQGLLDALGVCTPDLQLLINDLRAHTAITGAKISGSGLGDCIIGLGADIPHPQRIAAAISLEGVWCEKN